MPNVQGLYTIIADIVRWIIAIIVLPTVTWLLGLALLYPFEWLLRITTKWTYIFHLAFWFIAGYTLLLFAIAIGSMFPALASLLVRQKMAFACLFHLICWAMIGFFLYGAWSGGVGFSWEYLRYSTTNKVIFTLLCLYLAKIPMHFYAVAYNKS